MIVLLIIVALVVIGFAYTFHPRFGAKPEGKRLERMKATPTFQDGKFVNIHPTPDFGEGYNFWNVSKEFFFGNYPNKKPNASIPFVSTDLKSIDRKQDLLIWFGHSSYYFQLKGVRFLVDPVFSNNASPVAGTTKAFSGADSYGSDAIDTIDYLIITHDHYDHLDYATMVELKGKVKQVICGLGVGAHLERWGYDPSRITELYWQESATLQDVINITALPTRHFSGRSFQRNTTLWCSYMVQSDDFTLYLGGDSGYDTHFAEIGKQFPNIDLALLENGQYNVMWQYIHLLPKEFVQASIDLNAKRIFPIHNSKFSLALHTWNEPMDSLEVLGKDLLDVITPKIGEVVYLKDKTQKFNTWWKGL